MKHFKLSKINIAMLLLGFTNIIRESTTLSKSVMGGADTVYYLPRAMGKTVFYPSSRKMVPYFGYVLHPDD